MANLNSALSSVENHENEQSLRSVTPIPYCQGSMGLHQNNFNFKDPSQNNLAGSGNENIIVEVFRKFKDQCISRFRDGIHISPGSKAKIKDESEDPRSRSASSASCESETVKLEDLPFYCKLIILSKLDTIDICQLSMTSKHWREVCGDQFLWRELLFRDMTKWHCVGRNSFPLPSLSEFCKLMPSEDISEKEEKQKVESDTQETDNLSIPNAAYDLQNRLCTQKNVNFKALYFHKAYQRQKDAQLIGVAYCPDEDKHCDGVSAEQESITSSEQQLASNQSFPRFLRSLWMRMRSGNGDVIMLGPGMESPNTSKIFRRLLWARPDLLMTQRLLPGSQDGVGSGVELDFKGEKRFNLIALYSGNHRERRNRFGIQRLQRSNIVEQMESADYGNVGEEYSPVNKAEEASETSTSPHIPQSCTKFKLQELVLNFLKQRADTYRLIYVVDATQGTPLSQLACNRHELQALLEGIRSCENNVQKEEAPSRAENRHPSGENSTLSSLMNFTFPSSSVTVGPRRPVLILCCVQYPHVARIPCVEIASLLDLASITDRPWLVQDVTVNNLNGLENGLVWLFKQD